MSAFADLARRRALLTTALDVAGGIGHVVVGMARQDYDLQLTRYDGRGWRATFYVTGMEHSPTSCHGHGLGVDAVAGGACPGRFAHQGRGGATPTLRVTLRVLYGKWP